MTWDRDDVESGPHGSGDLDNMSCNYGCGARDGVKRIERTARCLARVTHLRQMEVKQYGHV